MPREVKNLLLAAIACFAALLPIAILAYWTGPTARLDAGLLERFSEHDYGSVHVFSAGTVALGELWPALAILACIVTVGFVAGRRPYALAAATIVLGANLTTQVLKHFFAHTRTVAEAHLYQGLPWPDAFPSGHTTAAASLAVGLLLVVPARFRALAAAVGVAFVAAMGFSVVVLQWHYPSDVVGGCLVVAGWSLGALGVLRLLSPHEPAAPAGVRSQTDSGPFAISLR